MILLKFWSKWPYFQGRDCKNLKPTWKNQAWWFCCFGWMTWQVETNFFNFQGNSLVWKPDWKSLNWKAVRIDERSFIRQHRQYGRFKKGRKKPKQRFTITFFVSWKTKNVMKIKIFLLEKKDELNVVWMIKVCWCFKSIKGAPRPGIVYFFVNSKSWITSDVFELYYQVWTENLSFKNRKDTLTLFSLYVMRSMRMACYLTSR